ncbi:MAG: siderophore-interacting protein [Bauldia sp.]
MPYHRCTVLRTAGITPRMRRITVGGESLRDYIHTGRFDEHCQVWFPRPGETAIDIPTDTGNPMRQPPLARIFTVRRLDREAGEIDIDFFLHDGGIATPWALNAKPGDPFVLTDSHGHDVIPEDTDWQLFIGDSAALPAIALVLEQLPDGVPATIVGIIPHDAERDALPGRAGVDLRWVVATRPAEIIAATVDAFHGFERPAGNGYVWVGGEATAARSIRRTLRAGKVPSHRFSAVGYWRDNSEAWEERYDAMATIVEARVTAARKAAADRDSFLEELDRIHIDAGL